jgi:diaminohydroxyphosphoribosylaminopyrimidine deaminase/5-amino-6-(5-phosphoribosylamino)uracil reductase
VIVGSNIPEDSKVLIDEASAQTLILNINGHRPRCPQATHEVSSLTGGLRVLAEDHDIMHVFCEGGGQLAAALIENGLVDEFAFFFAPKLMGADGLPNFAKTGNLISDITNLKFLSVEQVGDDVLIKAKQEK